jgi:hypothetical protein
VAYELDIDQALNLEDFVDDPIRPRASETETVCRTLQLLGSFRKRVGRKLGEES